MMYPTPKNLWTQHPELKLNSSVRMVGSGGLGNRLRMMIFVPLADVSGFFEPRFDRK
jgi:hypothetical protein